MFLRITLLALLIYSCDFPERDCLNFQTGTFEFKSISSTGDTLITKFTRTKDLEIGYFNGTIDSNTVKWVSNCECIYKKVNPKSFKEKKSVQMKILSTNKDSYTFEYSFVGDIKNKQRGFVKKIRN
tara:strand:- start:231 stop:608 length:378 start_codon:yes stop_codon:yes gene_type:complete